MSHSMPRLVTLTACVAALGWLWAAVALGGDDPEVPGPAPAVKPPGQAAGSGAAPAPAPAIERLSDGERLSPLDPRSKPGKGVPSGAGGTQPSKLLSSMLSALLPPTESARVVIKPPARTGPFTRERTLDLAVRRAEDGTVSLWLRVVDPPDLRGQVLLYERGPGGSIRAWTYDPQARRVRRTAEPGRVPALAGTQLLPEDLAGGPLVRLGDGSGVAWRLVSEGLDGGVVRRRLALDDSRLDGEVQLVVSRDPTLPLRLECLEPRRGEPLLMAQGGWVQTARWWHPTKVRVWRGEPGGAATEVQVVRWDPEPDLRSDTFSPRSLGRRR